MPPLSIHEYDQIQNRSIKKDHCFLCGVKLNRLNCSKEHIFSEWLLRRFNLWNNQLILLNRTSVSYRQAMISCCKGCNNILLSNIENLIKKASNDGFDKFSKLSEEKIFLWIQKVYYAIFYMEGRFLFDRSDKKGGTIIDDKFIQGYKACHLFLQAARNKVMFHKPYPWSIFIFKLQKYNIEKLNFDYRDHPSMAVAIRIGEVGIIACLQDNNTQKQYFGDIFERIKKISLHPIQFNELIAKVFYRESLRNRTPKYIMYEGKKYLEVNSLPLVGLSSKPIYDDWINAEYAKFLSFHCHIDYDKAYEKSSDKVWTILYNENSNLRELDITSCGF